MKAISKVVIRLLLGIMFVIAAMLKLLSIDYFEIYIYSFNIFSFELTTVISRLLICCELLLGFGLVFKICYRKVWWLSMLMIIGFTIFLLYVIAFRNDDNCHCFGELIRLNPSESIYKNVISILLLLVVRRDNDYDYKQKVRKWILGVSVAISIFLPFVVFPMDKLYNRIISKDNNINTVAFEKSLNDSTGIIRLNVVTENDSLVILRDSFTKLDIADDRYIINYISAGCQFCKMGANKLMMIMKHNEINKKHLKFIVWGYDADILDFMKETKTMDCEYWFINPMTSFNITYGKFPIFVWTEYGLIVDSGDLRDLDENQIIEFMK